MPIIRLIIVSLPGTLQRMLLNVIESQQSVEVVGIAQGGLSALQLVKEYNPDMLLIDSSIPIDEAVALIQRLKLESPRTKSIVLTDTYRRKHRIAQIGADYTLSSFNFPSMIGDILNDYPQNQPDVVESSGRSSD